jgi:site-specific recombinase XerD
MKKGRGMGGVYRPSYKTKAGEKIVSPMWWIYYNHNGKQIKENTNSAKEPDAWKLLKKRHGEIQAGKPVGPDVQRTNFEDMATMIENDYKANGRRSLKDTKNAIAHLREFFGQDRASEITGDRVTAYVAYRQEQKAAASTINGELAGLNRMFVLAMRAGKAAHKPHISKLELNNTRKGFFEVEQFNAVLCHLPEEIRPVAVTAYVTGWRVHDEILTRQKHHLDLKAGWLRLDPGETKNNEGRNFPLTPMLREVLERQFQRTEALQREKGVIIPCLFHRNGKRIKAFRRSWLTALVKAGFGTEIRNASGKLVKKVGSRIPHDFRRTAVRNLERAGVSRSDAMNMVGHKTEAIYRRYAISDEKSLKEAAAKLALQHEADQRAADKVIMLDKKTAAE